VAPTAAPTAAPANDDARSCFPASATVELADGTRVAVGSGRLTVGATVRSSPGRTSDVYAWSHYTRGGVHPFVAITTTPTDGACVAGGNATRAATRPPLLASPGHYVYIGGRLTAADAVAVGDVLIGGDGRPLTVTAVDRVVAAGLFNPHTLDGRLVVDGVAVSCYTRAVEPAVAAALLAPARWVYRVARAAGLVGSPGRRGGTPARSCVLGPTAAAAGPAAARVVAVGVGALVHSRV